MKYPFKNIFVSVIMPVYNTPCDYLSKAILSILNQTHSNFELIIVNDCSFKKETLKTIQEFACDARVMVINNSKNLGIAESLNLGIVKSIGKYIFRMDSDDISLRNRLAYSVKYLELNTEIDILGSHGFSISGRYRPMIMQITDNNIRLSSLFMNPFIHPTVVFRKSFIIKNSIRYNNVTSEDYDMWVRCQIDYNCKFSNLDKITLLYRVHNHQYTKTKINAINESFNFSRDLLLIRANLNIEEIDLFKAVFDPDFKFYQVFFKKNYSNLKSLITKLLNSHNGFYKSKIFILKLNIKWIISHRNVSRLQLLIFLIRLKNSIIDN